MRRGLGLFIVAILAVALLPKRSAAQALADKVPDDAILYFGWAGTDNLGPAYEGSHLKAVVDHTDWNDFITRFIPEVVSRISHDDRKVSQVMGIVTSISKTVVKHPTAVYVGPADMTDPKMPVPRIAVFIQAGDDAPALVMTLRDLLVKIPSGPSTPPMNATNDNGMVTLVIGTPPAEGKPIKDSPQFQAALKEVSPDPVIVGYVSGEKLWAAAEKGFKINPNPQLQEQWTRLSDLLGLKGLKTIIWAGGFDDKDCATALFIEASEPRTGIIKYLDAKPLPDETLKRIPVSAVMANAGRCDLTAVLNAFKEGGVAASPEFGGMYDSAMDSVHEAIGVDLNDIAEPFGDQWVMYVDPAIGGNGFLGMTLQNQLDDPAKAKDVLSRAEQGINGVLEKLLKGKDAIIQFKTAQRNGVEIHYLAIPMVTPSWAIDDGTWYFGLYPQIVTGAIANVHAGGKSILDNPAYQQVRQRLGNQPASSVSFVDVPKLVPAHYGTWLLISHYTGYGDVFGIDSPLMLLPPMSDLKNELTPSGSIEWTDARGYHARGICSFPGDQILAGSPTITVGGAALAVSILLPAVSKARAEANNVASLANIRQIALDTQMYCQDHKGRLPNDLGDLFPYVKSIKIFVTARSNTEIPPSILDAAPEIQVKWIMGNSDYIYKGGGRKITDTQPGEIMIYEDPAKVSGDRINVGYYDGHAESMPRERVLQLIGK